MSIGRNEFLLELNRKDIAEIVDRSKQLRIEDQAFIRAAPYEDVMAAYVLMGLMKVMQERRVEPGFKLVLNE